MDAILTNISTIIFWLYIATIIAIIISMAATFIFIEASESILEIIRLAGIPFVTCLVLCFALYAPDGTIKNAIDDMEEFNNKEQEMVRAFGVFGMFLPHRDIENDAYTTLKNKTMEEL
ncbi:hypothetical protein SOX05_08875 [Pseudomonas putida]|nr:hypothetical protein [Pseudomonas putida]MDY4319375.1 hypothetical protein [Pseudomonas putida]MDY4352760.1 hypothetical protein [Pseudomonas putida]